MSELPADRLRAFVFKQRGALLAIPAVGLALFGKPSALGVTLGLPIALAGELLRCWAVGYTGVTTRGDRVAAPELITGGPYAHVRNPLYVGNFVTAAGFALAFTGKNAWPARWALVAGSLGAMAAVYATIVPHEERFLHAQFGDAFERYRERVPSFIPQSEPMPDGTGRWRASAIKEAESKTFITFAAMLTALAVKAMRG